LTKDKEVIKCERLVATKPIPKGMGRQEQWEKSKTRFLGPFYLILSVVERPSGRVDPMRLVHVRNSHIDKSKLHNAKKPKGSQKRVKESPHHLVFR
jgi:hypothetical protein